MLSFLLGITIGCTRQVSLFAAEVSMSIYFRFTMFFFEVTTWQMQMTKKQQFEP
jgi:hypothetical protein